MLSLSLSLSLSLDLHLDLDLDLDNMIANGNIYRRLGDNIATLNLKLNNVY
jgi:hypothetical protein